MAWLAFDFMRLCTYDIARNINHDHISKNWLLIELCNHRKLGYFTDVTIILADNSVLYVHSIVLASQSIYFTTMLTCSFVESTSRIIRLDTYDPQCVRSVIDYMYTGILDITSTNIVDTFILAHYFHLDQLLIDCIECLCESIDFNNMLVLHRVSVMTLSVPLYKRIIGYASYHFVEFIETDIFSTIHHDMLRDILDHAKCATINNQQLYNYCIIRATIRLMGYLKYIKHDPDNRLHDLPINVPKLHRCVSYVDDIRRQQLLCMYPEFNNQLRAIFTDIPVNIQPIDLLCDLITDTTVLGSNDRRGDHSVSLRTEYVSDYGHVVGLDIYYHLTTHNRTVLSAIIVLYHSGTSVTIGIINSRDILYSIRLADDISTDERIIDICAIACNRNIHQLTFYSSLHKIYGPYGSHRKTRSDIVYKTLLPDNYYTDRYLYGISANYSELIHDSVLVSRIHLISFIWARY